MHAVPGGPYSSERKLPPEIEENFKAALSNSICQSTSSTCIELKRDLLTAISATEHAAATISA